MQVNHWYRTQIVIKWVMKTLWEIHPWILFFRRNHKIIGLKETINTFGCCNLKLRNYNICSHSPTVLPHHFPTSLSLLWIGTNTKGKMITKFSSWKYIQGNLWKQCQLFQLVLLWLESLKITFIHLSLEQRTVFISINLKFFQIMLIVLSGAPDQWSSPSVLSSKRHVAVWNVFWFTTVA